MKLELRQAALFKMLREKGFVSAGDLVRGLRLSRATLASLLTHFSGQVVSVGETRNRHYGLMRPLPDLSAELPLFRITHSGQLNPIGKLVVLHDGCFLVQPQNQKFFSLPMEIIDMQPQGFMGRAFASQFADELGLSPRLQDWSDDHFLRAIARRGEDLPGNLVLGEESALRWQKNVHAPIRRTALLKNANRAMEDQPIGSSAGGEQPKFTSLIEGKHCLVKFSGPFDRPDKRRWCDLLHCEAIAGDVLKSHGIDAASTRMTVDGQFVFLEVERFDRVGLQGRKSYVSFAAVDGFLFGNRDSWTASAIRLQQARLLSEVDLIKIKTIDLFARLIGDSDRHFHNLGLWPNFENEASLLPMSYKLAPVFDKLPMMFAPIDGRVIEREFIVPVPGADVIDVWKPALSLAKTFWDVIAKHQLISAGFRKIAKDCLGKL
jgi:hypothetical protein